MIDATTFLEVSTLGRFEIRRDHNPLSGGNWTRRKVCDLFKLLLAADQHRLHREQIQEILWPSSTSEQAANSLNKTLYLLRRALEPDLVSGRGSASTYVLLDHDTLLLIPERMEIDADLFEAAAKQLQVKMRSRSTKGQDNQDTFRLLDEFDRVLALYGGDYLPEDLYEDWAQRRRDRLRRIHSWLLENAAELALDSVKGQRACEYLQALLERNSADEQTHCQLMLVYARMGRRSDALNQYQLLREALREELHAYPLPETTELYRSIQSGRITVDLEIPFGSRHPTSPHDRGKPVGGHKSPIPAQHHPRRHYHDTERVDSSDAHSGSVIRELGETPKSNGKSILPKNEVADPETEDQSQIDPNRILKAELVGRQAEISIIQRAYSQACNGQRKAVFIFGEPGIGKTRLAREFTHWGEETQQAGVLWGYCYEMSGSLPYQPIADAINAHVRLCSPEQLRSILGNSAVDLAKIAPEVRFKLPELPEAEPIGPEVERRNLYNAVARYFNTLAEERPLIIILDDLQWADAATIQLLNFLMLQSAGVSPFDTVGSANNRRAVPLYLLLYRADEMHETHPLRGLMATLARGGISADVRLQRLTETEVQQLLVNIAGHAVRPNFAAEIYRQTEGNPFFIGEAIRSLILEGKIKWTGERWKTTVDINELEIPQSVRLLIERRLVHLSPECRTTMAVAAVLGRQFSSALLCQACNLSEEVVAEHIDDAIRAQILSGDRKDSYTDREFRAGTTAPTPTAATQSQDNELFGRDIDLAFTHDKIREVLYQWLNPLRRKILHRQVAQAIEARYAAHLQPYYSTLAYHYQMAESLTQAIDSLLKAATYASSVYAFVDTAAYMQTALDLLMGDEERPRRAALLRQLSETYLYTGRPDKAIEAGMAAATLWRDIGDEAKQAEAYLHVAFCCHWQGRELEAVEFIKRALQCIGTEQEYLLAKANTQWGMAATILGDAPLARAKLQQANELHAKVGGNDPFIQVVSLWSLSWCAFLAESPAKMLEYALQGAEVCRSTQNPAWAPMMDYSAAWAYMLLGRLEEGQQMARNAIKKAQQHGVVGAQGWTNLVQAFLAIQAGNWEEAAQCADSASVIATMLDDANLQARVLWSRSVCAGWRADWVSAITDSKEAIQLAKKDGETSMVLPYLLVQAAKAYYYMGKTEEAQLYLDQAIQLAESHQYRQLPAIAQRLQGRIWQAQGRFEEAQPCFERSLAELLALDDMVEYARTQEAYGLYYLARKKAGFSPLLLPLPADNARKQDEEKGQELLTSAREMFKSLGVNG